jgi:hypothetical protein
MPLLRGPRRHGPGAAMGEGLVCTLHITPKVLFQNRLGKRQMSHSSENAAKLHLGWSGGRRRWGEEKNVDTKERHSAFWRTEKQSRARASLQLNRGHHNKGTVLCNERGILGHTIREEAAG